VTCGSGELAALVVLGARARWFGLYNQAVPDGSAVSVGLNPAFPVLDELSLEVQAAYSCGELLVPNGSCQRLLGGR
jgi:hypothetical protein